ncbi:hypothetical protein SteCoe_24961 [Stentor coeruleus]|uniref:Protein kinase domain-containing protein n=1 Tax=Stentor coeruleus TaxID=5963 RepID=A0A1R2BGC4_9CILI|nr:hypothetical protein SteCoe_24961 [Stentor coeruleus]
MRPSTITRKGTIRKRAPEKKIIIVHNLDDSYSLSDHSAGLLHDEIAMPNLVCSSPRLENVSFNSKAYIPKAPLSPSLPFGPKAKARIIPCKDLSDTAHNVEMDVLDNYNVWSDIGKGSYAVVKLATHKQTMMKCAIKIYSKKSLENPTLKKNVMREIKILKKIDHNNIVKFYEEISGVNNLYIVMEYVKGISLNNHLVAKSTKKLTETETCDIFKQVAEALAYCHEKNITHRDIKMENVQLDLNFNVKLIDFGFATCFSNDKKTLIFCGSPTYMAPEIINHQASSGPPVDVWAAGILLFVLVTGDFPFKGNTEKRVFDKVKKGSYKVPDDLSRPCCDLIRSILDPNPITRITAKDILIHPWILNGGNIDLHSSPSKGDYIDVFDEDCN